MFLVSVDGRGSSECTRSLGLTLLYWSPFHLALPAVAFVEEALEASLSRLAKMTFSSYHADDVSGVGAMYSSLGPASSKKRDLVKPGVSRVFVKQLVIRLGKLLDHIVVGTMPHVATGKAHKVSGTRLWPAGRLVLPPRVLMVDRDVTFYADVLVNAMHVMMKAGSPGAWDHELVAGLAAGAPRLSRKKLAARTEMVGFLDKKKRKWRKAAADARGSGKRRRHLGDVRSGEPIGMRHPCSFSPLLTSPFTVQSVVAAAAVGPALGCVGSVGEMSADDADSVTDADGASQDEIQSQDSRSVASSARSSPSRACTSGPGSDADGFEGPDSDCSGYVTA